MKLMMATATGSAGLEAAAREAEKVLVLTCARKAAFVRKYVNVCARKRLFLWTLTYVFCHFL